jgi:hypothetical protein
VVDIAKKEIHLQGRVFKITSFSTWWAVEGLGVFSSLDEVAKEVPADSLNLLNVRPVPVAVSDQVGVYEVL